MVNKAVIFRPEHGACTKAIALVLFCVPVILSFFKEPIYCDSAFYLSIIERIADGYVPYKTMALGYAPLWFYLMAALKSIFHIGPGNYAFYLIFHYLFLVGGAICLEKIAKQLNFSKEVSIFSVWLFLMSSFWMSGNIVLLEIPSIFWGLLSMLLCLSIDEKYNMLFFIAGIACSLSFLTKQFGLGFLFLDILILVEKKRNFIKQASYLVIGFLFPVAVCFVIWRDSFIPVVLNGYGSRTAVEIGRSFDFPTILEQVISNIAYYSWRICPVLIILIFFIPLIIKQKKTWVLFLLLCGFIGFSLQFVFVPGGLHYSLYMLPFSSLLVGLVLSVPKRTAGKILASSAIAFTVLLCCYSVYYNRVFKRYLKSDAYAEQIDMAKQVSEVVPRSSKLWIVHGGLVPMYYLTNLLPPNIETIGYSFGPLSLTEEKAYKQIKGADYVLAYQADYDFESFFTPSVKSFLINNSSSTHIGDDVVLYKMNLDE